MPRRKATKKKAVRKKATKKKATKKKTTASNDAPLRVFYVGDRGIHNKETLVSAIDCAECSDFTTNLCDAEDLAMDRNLDYIMVLEFDSIKSVSLERKEGYESLEEVTSLITTLK